MKGRIVNIHFGRNLLGVLSLAACVLAYADIWQDSHAREAAGKYPVAATSLAGNEYAQMQAAYLAYMEGRFDDSVAVYQRLVSDHPHSIDALLGLTLPLLAKKRCADVRAVAQKVIQMSAWQYTAHLRLLQCHEITGDWNGMAETARQLTLAYPSDATAWVYFARGQVGSRNGAGARRAYERALQIVPEHKEAVAYLGESPLAK
jgi:tetratricopeptide (TPR) repeat protein